jgi:hypothetical protein
VGREKISELVGGPTVDASAGVRYGPLAFACSFLCGQLVYQVINLLVRPIARYRKGSHAAIASQTFVTRSGSPAVIEDVLHVCFSYSVFKERCSSFSYPSFSHYLVVQLCHKPIKLWITSEQTRNTDHEIVIIVTTGLTKANR